MSDLIISVESLVKKYRLDAGHSNERSTILRHTLTHKARYLFQRNRRTDMFAIGDWLFFQ